MYNEIIQKHQEIILSLYLHQNFKKAQIAHKLIHDLDIDLTNAQVDSFRRSLSQFLSDWEEEHPNYQINPDGQITIAPKITEQIPTKAKVLILDLETTPIIGAFWSLFKININTDQIFTDSRLLCWAGKWLFESETFGDVLTPEECVVNHNSETTDNLWAVDDFRIVQSLWKVMDEADIIIAHNGRKFDTLVANTFFLRNHLPLPSPYEIIDTLESAKKAFRFPSNKLDYINRYLGLSVKEKTEFRLWLRCLEGRKDSLLRMFNYCKNDVGILEEHYVIVRPWIKSHPNMGFYVESDDLICPTCGCDELKEIKPYRTIVNEYVSYRCPNCGATGRSRHTSVTPEKKQTLTISLGR